MALRDLRELIDALAKDGDLVRVAAEVGGVDVLDLYAYVESFCGVEENTPFTPGSHNYTRCATQTLQTGLHFFTAPPLPQM